MDKTYFLRSNLFPYQDHRINPNYLTNFIYRQGELQSPLDLSLRGPVPITPPSTPSPPRKGIFISENKIFDKKQFQYLIENDDCVLLSNSESIKEERVRTETDEFIDITSQDEIKSDGKISENCSNSGYETDDKTENLEDLEKFGILKEGKGYFENSAYHSQAIEGFAKLFEKSFTKNFEQEENEILEEAEKQDTISEKISKIDKKKFKSRKQSAEEDNTSPVSGTIIRKLRDDEELVVRKVKFN